MEYILIPFIALLASMLTFFSGFGLGTILLPAFILYFPPEIAVLLTAIVHFLNNTFKIGLIGGHLDKKTLLWFGIPALIFAYFGAKTLLLLPSEQIWYEGEFAGLTMKLSPINLVIGCLMVFFALFELIPSLKKIQFSNKWLLPGGMLSGFFGGLSGHQGALRSAFLVKSGLTKEAFVATGVGIALLVDVTRISVYVINDEFKQSDLRIDLLILALVFAFGGAIIGKYLLKKITISFIQNLVGFIMMVLGIGLILGFFTK